MKPACMDTDEYQLWLKGNRAIRGEQYRARTPCHDCTPLFHQDMLDGGMCDGVPGPPKVGPPFQAHDYTYAELKAMRAQYSRFGAPASLLVAVRRAYWRERERVRRAVA